MISFMTGFNYAEPSRRDTMRSPQRKSSRQVRRASDLCYATLENRRVLATILGFDAGTGALTITMDANNDAATVSVANGNVSVNGSEDLDAAAGTQSSAFVDLRSITVVGDPGMTNQALVLGGNYSTDAGGLLQTITVSQITNVTIQDQYDLSANFSVVLNGTGGGVSDGAAGRISVAGTTELAANANSVELNNAANDFVGDISVSTTGVGQDMSFGDANDIQFKSAVGSGDLLVNAVGNISDAVESTLTATDARFVAASLVFGENATDVVDFTRFESTTTGVTVLNQDTLVTLLNINASNLTVRSTAGIYDGRTTTIAVNGNSNFESTSRIRIGENGTDTFNTGSLTFNGGSHVHITANSGVLLVGSSTAGSLDLFSENDIIDDFNARLNVTNDSGFEALNIVLGDSAADEFNSGSLHFSTPGDFFVAEDSGIHFVETKNRARRMSLTSTGSITDADDVQIDIERLSLFSANSVNLGDTAEDSFNSGSILFVTDALFKISENSDLNIVGVNTANNSIIESTGTITNIFVSGGGNGTNLTVDMVAEFRGASLDLGTQAADSFRFGSLRFNSEGNVEIQEDNAMNLEFSSTAGQLVLNATGGLTDAAAASLNVTGVASLQAASILLGDTAADEFNASSVTLNSIGAVGLTENSALNLSGANTANALTLVAAGDLTDSVDASTTVVGLFHMTGTAIDLGDQGGDSLVMSSLTFHSTANTRLNANSDILLVGVNTSDDEVSLTSTGDIEDAPTASTRISNKATFEGVDVIIGELADDCFDILNGDASDLTVTASGTSDVQLGGC
ncbi:MAG: hypothetical protein ACI87E_003466 [Mariniblastus sp.]|jgi:hypothetical protein